MRYPLAKPPRRKWVPDRVYAILQRRKALAAKRASRAGTYGRAPNETTGSKP